MTSHILRRICFAIAVLLAANSAHADIAAFNAAVSRDDYKAAAVEAARTWPTLDKTRADIRVIAGEFGFMSYLAGDFALAQTFAEFAANPASHASQPDPQSVVLWRLSQHKLDPTRATRDQLFDALAVRAAAPDSARIAYAAANTLLTYDFNRRDWKRAQESSALGVRAMSAGGPSYLLENRRFELFNIITDYMNTQTETAWGSLNKLLETTGDDIDAAPTDEDAKLFVPLRWETLAWWNSIDSLMRSRGVNIEEQRRLAQEEADKRPERSARFKALTGSHRHDLCPLKYSETRTPAYPSIAGFRGFVGTVIAQVDIEETGAASNPVILATVPDRYFVQAFIKNVPRMRYQREKEWDASCSLAEKGHIVIVKFMIGG